ncbi:MAG: hypothetical protein JNL98_16295 [Bryobacterales bacterium]|nr:hypothetical protein [Bryobacterales bacterium]
MPQLTICNRRMLLATAILATLAIPMSAQTQNIRVAHRFRVKPDRIGDFRAILRDAQAVLQKEKFDRTSLWYESLTGPQEFVWVRSFKDLADAGATHPISNHPAIVALSTRLATCVESREIMIDEILPEVSITSTEMPSMLQALRTSALPGKGEDYVALIKSDLFPALRKAGTSTYVFARRRMGGPSETYVSVRGLKGWSDLDGIPNARKAMGDENYRKFLAKRATLVRESESTVYRYLADLSYAPK